MGEARPSSRTRSYIPNTMFLFFFLSLIIHLIKTIKPAHKMLSLTHWKCRGKANIWILSPLLQKNEYGRSQLLRDQISSRTIYLYNRKFDWCLIVDPIWLVWHTCIFPPPPPPPPTPEKKRDSYLTLWRELLKICTLRLVPCIFIWNMQISAICFIDDSYLCNCKDEMD